MLPDNRPSTQPVPAPILDPNARRTNDIEDFELGGVALNDPSQGLRVRVWRCWLAESTKVMIQGEGHTPLMLFEAEGITELALAFDQNMRPALAYMQDEVMKLNWYDSAVGEFVTTEFPGDQNPRLTIDDKRPLQAVSSDIIMAYMRDQNVYYRQQRDRFLIERLFLENVPPAYRLFNLGMGTNWRLVFQLRIP